jgi:hypothetical protein
MRDGILAPLAGEDGRSFRLSCEVGVQTHDFSALVRLSVWAQPVGATSSNMTYESLVEPLVNQSSCASDSQYGISNNRGKHVAKSVVKQGSRNTQQEPN